MNSIKINLHEHQSVSNGRERMSIIRMFYPLCSVFLLFVICGCSSSPSSSVIELKNFPVDSIEGIITTSGVFFDKNISSDGNGSLRINAEKPTVVRLYEINNLNVDNARLIYSAKLRTEDVKGHAYLEMWCHFPGNGAFYSRGLHAPLSGSTQWTTEEIPFFLRKGENPDTIKLNLVIEGSGTVWIDDIRLLKGPLQ